MLLALVAAIEAGAATPLRLPPSGKMTETIDCAAQPSVARAWNEQTLAAIRRDAPRPTVHARNLFHVSAAMYDAWSAFSSRALAVYHSETIDAQSPDAAAIAVSHAAYRLLVHRFSVSPGAAATLAALRSCMLELELDPDDLTVEGSDPAALGNRVAASVIAHGSGDGANEIGNYADDGSYFPANAPMLVQLSGTGGMADPNAWQPLIPPGAFGIQSFLTPFWGQVATFALERPGPDLPYLDPGPPPLLGGPGDEQLKTAMLELIRASANLDPDTGITIDRSPAVVGNNPLGSDNGSGYSENPVTGLPYSPNPMRLGDYGRVSAEFWADGPQSSTPPGHWNEIANAVFDHPAFTNRLGGQGPLLDRLEWDVKAYLALNGALHDAAVASWEIKRRYDSSRPISLIREMGSLGQSSDPDQPSWHPSGLPLEGGLVEIITTESSAAGERHAHLAGHIGEVALLSWLGHPAEPATDYGGVGWIRAVDWWPYQQVDFVTPAFPGYTSGHSGFSRAAAEVLRGISGSPWFPGGLASYQIQAEDGSYSLQFEYGPSEPVTLQWVSYYDAADEAGQSRIWGGIHPDFDDYPGRIMGAAIGQAALDRALTLFGPVARTVPVPGPGKPAMLLLIAALLISVAVSYAGPRRA